MSAQRNSFKFTLKPSSLSQHTANFNKILEQVPVPKVEPLELVKPADLKTETKKVDINSQENKTEKENTQTDTTSVKEFIFGEKLTDRVVNVAPEDDSNPKPADEEAANSQQSTKSDTDTTHESKPLWPITTENEADQIENNEANTILKLNCKLFVLEPEKSKWNERGYGILKVIDSNDGVNCKIMMWTDKCFRLILNTKFFEKMQLDRANQKSIRFNAYDSGSIRIFLIKTGNPNDCDELYSLLEKRFNDYLAHLEVSKQNSVTSSSQEKSTNVNKSPKDILFRCPCDLTKSSNESRLECEIHLYNQSTPSITSTSDNQPSSNSHQLMLDIIDSNTDAIHLTTYLKYIKIKNKTKPVEFEVNESFTTKLTFRVEISNEEFGEKFLTYYEKEPNFHLNADESSNEGSDASSSTSDESESESGSQRKRDNSSQPLDVKEDEEKLANKKRKTVEECSSSDELNKKTFKKSDSSESNLNESDLKRANEEDPDIEEKETTKKSKLSEDSNEQP